MHQLTCSHSTTWMYRGLEQTDSSGWSKRSTTILRMSCNPADRRFYPICLVSVWHLWTNSRILCNGIRNGAEASDQGNGCQNCDTDRQHCRAGAKGKRSLPRIADGALATAEKHPDDALLTATARVVQTQAAPVKMGKPVHVPANGKKTAGRQALKGKQETRHFLCLLRRGWHAHGSMSW